MAIMKVEPLNSVYQTAANMVRFVRSYHSDVAPFDRWTLEEFYYYVRDLPYIDDGHDERIARPLYTIPVPTMAGTPPKGYKCTFRDCDDKAIAIACFLYRMNMPFRFVACSYTPGDDIHHVVVQTQDPKCIIDATYPDEDDMPPTKKYYHMTPLCAWIRRYKW